MKRWIRTVLALVLALGLTGCSGNQNDAPPLYAPDHVERISEAGAFSEELEELDGDTAFALYGLSGGGLVREDLTQCAVLRSAGATCEECAVLVLASADKAETAVESLKDYVQNQINANTDYRPSEIPKLENALIDQREETVLLVIANDLDAAEKAVE